MIYNLIPLCKKLKPQTFSEALEIYHQMIKGIERNENKFRLYLLHLNSFIYGYYIMEYKKDLITQFTNSQHMILKAKDTSKLHIVGEIMLKEYADEFMAIDSINEHVEIQKCLEFIHDNFTNKLTLKDVASEVNISRNYLCYIFKEQTGYTFCQYLNVLRVNYAKKLIRTTDYSMEYIADLCGFSSQSHLSTNFKKYAGMPPMQYKKSLTEDKKPVYNLIF